jgi:type IV pilus assembly protein PilA
MRPDGRSPLRRLMPLAVLTALGSLSFGWLIVWPAYAKLNKGRMYAQEVNALRAIMMVHTAQVRYRSQFNRYAKTLVELGPRGANEIPSDLASGVRQGYRFALTPTLSGYTIAAVPVAFGSTGARTFYSDQTFVIRENYGPAPATVNSKEVGRGRLRSDAAAIAP